MAANDANIATIRSRHEVYLYASVAPEVEILRGTISGTYTDSVTSVTYANVSGSHTAVSEDMEAEIFDSGGTSKGRLRVAPGGATSTVVQVEEVSQGRVEIVSGDQIRVYRSWRLRSRLVASSETFDKDSRVAYGDQTDLYAPVAIIGGGKPGFIDPATSVLTVSFSASTSYAVDPDSGGTLTYLWNVDDGTITVGTSTSASITATFPAGARWVSLTVTDSSNSKSYTQYAPVWAHEISGANAPIPVRVTSLGATLEAGWACEFDLVNAQDADALPDGALIYIWADSLYGSTKVAYGSDVSDRSHIKFVGYLVRNVEEFDAESNDESQSRSAFTALSPLALLARMAGFSQVLEYTASPTEWFDATDLSVMIALDYLIRWGTTFLRVHDWIFDATDYAYSAFYIQENTPLAQLRELVEAIDAQLVCTRLGRCIVQSDLLVSSSAVRSAASTQLALTDSDVISGTYDEEHRYQYSQIEVRAITPGVSVADQKPVYAVAPGKAPVEGAPQRIVYDRRIGVLSEVRQRAGWRFARDNHVYDGLPVASNITLTLWIGYDVFDLFAEWVVLTLSADLFLHGEGFSNAKCVISATNITYDDAGGGTVQLTLQQETRAAAGSELILAQPSTNNDEWPDIITDLPLITWPVTIAPTPPNLLLTQPEDPTQIFVVGGAAGEAALITFDWATGAETATSTFGGSMTGVPIWARGDPYNAVDKYVATEDGLWLLDDITSAPAGTLVASPNDMFGTTCTPGHFNVSINRRGYFIISACGSSAHANTTSGVVTFDYGASFTSFDITGGAASFASTTDYMSNTLAVSPWNDPNTSGQGWVYGGYCSGTTLHIARSTDWGVTWADIFTVSSMPASGYRYVQIYIPYRKADGTPNRNTSTQVMYIEVNGYGVSNDNWMGMYYANGSSIWARSITGVNYGVSDVSRQPWNTLDSDGSYLYAQIGGGVPALGVIRSTAYGSDMYNTSAEWQPGVSAYEVGTPATSLTNWWSGFNGWGADGTLVHYSPGLINGSGTLITSTGNALWQAYDARGYADPGGFLRVIRYNTDTDWSIVLTGLTEERTAYAEFQIVG